MNKRLAVCLLLLAVNWQVNAAETMRVIWDKKPIKVTLAVGKEKLLSFPEKIKVWFPNDLRGKVKHTIADGVLYITATATFSETRFRVHELETDKIYLLDLSAVAKKAVRQRDIQVVTPEVVEKEAKESIEKQTKLSQKKKVDWYVRLTRHASQALYAPERLMPSDPAIQRMPVNKAPVSIIRGERVKATPIAAWSGGNFYVTAIKLQSQSNQVIDLDFNVIRGQWLAATLQHFQLYPRGDMRDTTTLYVISQHEYSGVNF
ncbi:TIGR03749 family integrating conjugative element protein [Endozoicomonas sp. SM1973]|uniref:TIGR03749 family integrating conjugative element protein n=1 Tax=Spartinivicinus marinus TaxID=2994442 RepID=A0A853I7Y3_9GAMM|nr:TIGR03749 family integrating conjugative element protein [Spartinivicinus marinus]MCX4030179.1 TIGR03749 family integrating conjugative element protein [Spartinivicinus marinus]NYZ67822.1 TIGR03749 family integrating conjugative element protein [Spartinivicinus marinus]